MGSIRRASIWKGRRTKRNRRRWSDSYRWQMRRRRRESAALRREKKAAVLQPSASYWLFYFCVIWACGEMKISERSTTKKVYKCEMWNDELFMLLLYTCTTFFFFFFNLSLFFFKIILIIIVDVLSTLFNCVSSYTCVNFDCCIDTLRDQTKLVLKSHY